MVKKNEEPSSFFKYTPLAILLAGASVVASAAFISKDVPKEDVAVVYPAPVEEKSVEVEVAEAPAVPVDPAPEAEPAAPAPVIEEKPEPPPVVMEAPQPVPEVKEEPKKAETPSQWTVPGIEWPVVEEPNKDELPTVVVEAVPVPEKKPVVEKKKCPPKKEEETTLDIFKENFMRGNGF